MVFVGSSQGGAGLLLVISVHVGAISIAHSAIDYGRKSTHGVLVAIHWQATGEEKEAAATREVSRLQVSTTTAGTNF